ncbi:MAG: contractile injection system tape measure protein [Ginsengibacter sp.]
MEHIIKKQLINLSLDKRLDAFHIQQLVSSNYWNKIVPLLQQAFDDASNEDETISLDTLEIDLGIINEKEIEKGAWEKDVFKKITEQLLPVKQGLSSKENIKKKSKSLTISGQWIFYMKHGYLPWNVSQINLSWYDKVLEAFAGDAVAIDNLRNLINNNPNSVKRIIFQHSEQFLQALVETLTAENQDALPEFINEILMMISFLNKKSVHTSIFQKKEGKQKLWEQVLLLAATGEKNLNFSTIGLRLLSKNFSGNQFDTKKMKDFLSKNQMDINAFKQVKKEKQDEESNSSTEEISVKDLIEKNYDAAVDEDGIYVLNAGIILLHPFLTRFFRNLQLVNGESFSDTFSHQKALYLLHYLSTGNVNPEEHELVIAKVLCAFPPDEPVNAIIEISIEELQEADNLLMSAIGQWEVLKSTSPDGLREGFLQRNGKLFTKNGRLHLQVEASSIDMLLDQLPWNLNMVKLPWMNDILKVEWR